MKNIFTILFFSFCILSYSQEIILSENVIHFFKLKEDADQAIFKVVPFKADKNTIREAIDKCEILFKFSENSIINKSLNYADLLAEYGDLEKAIQYYEIAFNHQKMTAEEFGYPRREKYFEKDTLLYKLKKKEFDERAVNYYSKRELELLIEVKEMLAKDQIARKYYGDYPEHKECTKNIIEYVDSITMAHWIELMEKYPEYDNPLDINFNASFVIGRHIFTVYPEFWLTYIEPKERKKLLNGIGYPKGYARTFDRCVISSGREPYSFYGEWDNDGKNVNPNKELVNKRRVNLSLPLLEDKKNIENEIFRTY